MTAVQEGEQWRWRKWGEGAGGEPWLHQVGDHSQTGYSIQLLLEQHLDAPRALSWPGRLHINPQCLEILTLIRDKRKITHHYHYNLLFKNTPIHDTLYLVSFPKMESNKYQTYDNEYIF
jgi:hypothetical protein